MKTEPTSPGAALSGRVSVEAALTRLTIRELRRFLLAVERAAAREAASPLAGGTVLHPLALAEVTDAWDDLVDAVVTYAIDENTALTAGGWSERNLQIIVGDLSRAGYVTGIRERVRSSDVPVEAFNAARKILTRGRAEDWSVEQTTRALTRALSKDAPPDAGASFDTLVRRIARTEATTIFNYSTLTYAANRGATFKRWISHHDSRTRDSHRAADGQKAPLEDPFIVGGSRLFVPGDPDAPTSETANCRCIMVAE